MSYNGGSNSINSISYSDPPQESGATSFKESAELKLYQTFIFTVPVFFTFVLLFLLYLFYLRRSRVDWASLRMRTSSDDSSRAEMGLKKEVREMLPIIVFKQSFSVKDTLCSVCLGEYQAEERLQQIPACGHTFHMACIDNWLSTHATCPLCRQSLICSAKSSSEAPDVRLESNNRPSNGENGGEMTPENGSHHSEDISQGNDSSNTDEANLMRCSEEEGTDARHVDTDRGMMRNNER